MKTTNKLTFCGIISGLGVVTMLLTGVFPMAEFTLPAIAGILLMPVVVECGIKWAFLCYGAISLLSLFLCPAKDAAVFFILILGCYPILKSPLESIQHKALEIFLKYLFFNGTALLGTALMIWLFNMEDYTALLSESPAALAALLFLINAAFFIYDRALTRLISSYINWFRPKYLKRLL